MKTTPARSPRRLLSLSALALLITGAVLYAGPLDPPAGPVAPTYKTLTEVEPRIAINAANTPGDADSLFKITQRGSYYLTGNITGVVGKHGIEIAASGVTLDLNGFDLVGVAAMGAFDGVSVTANGLTNITIRNGSVRGWGDEGVDLGTAFAIISTVIDVRASNNTGNGIQTGSGSTITGCSASNNTGTGITLGDSSTMAGCTAYQNNGDGISTAIGSTISGCTASLNTGNGISAGNGCTISNCTARLNTLDGIRVGSGCLILANTCWQNGFGAGAFAGIHATGSRNRIEGNNCLIADGGIDVDSGGNIIIKNTCSGNTINWDIVANNVVGPILDRTFTASAAISGNSAPSSLGSTDANANFSY